MKKLFLALFIVLLASLTVGVVKPTLISDGGTEGVDSPRHEMWTYLEGFLGSYDPDTREDPWINASDIYKLDAHRKVTPEQAPTVLFQGVVRDEITGEEYLERESVYAYAYTMAFYRLEALSTTLAYEIDFEEAIPLSAGGHGLQIYFLGRFWVVTSLENFEPGVSCSITGCSMQIERDGYELNLVHDDPFPGTDVWTITFFSGETNGEPAFKKLVVRDISSRYSLEPGEYAPIIDSRAGEEFHTHNLRFDGLISADYDNLNLLLIANQPLPTSANDTKTQATVIHLTSALANPFGQSVGSSDPVNELYFVVGQPRGQALLGDIFYYYRGYYQRFVHPNGGNGINFVDYVYKTGTGILPVLEQVTISLNTSGSEEEGYPDFRDFVLAIPEFWSEPTDESKQGGWFFDVGNTSGVFPLMFQSSIEHLANTPYNHSVVEHHLPYLADSPFTSWRGVEGSIVDLQSASLNYSLDVVRAQYAFEKISSPVPTTSAKKTPPGKVPEYEEGAPTTMPKTKTKNPKSAAGLAAIPPSGENQALFLLAGVALIVVSLGGWYYLQTHVEETREKRGGWA